jgi:hypothetical protein
MYNQQQPYFNNQQQMGFGGLAPPPQNNQIIVIDKNQSEPTIVNITHLGSASKCAFCNK